jgi:deoxyadenosine/deoxycytidine kinase
MTRYKMMIVFDAHEEVPMKYVVQERLDGEKVALAQEVMRGVSYESDKNRQPHINKLYEDIFERIETSSKHPITYDIISFEKLKEEQGDMAEKVGD